MRKIALRATLIQVRRCFARLVGENSLTNYGIPLPVLTLAGGIILFLVALPMSLSSLRRRGRTKGSAVPTLQMASMPLAFPTIVTPPGIAGLIRFPHP